MAAWLLLISVALAFWTEIQPVSTAKENESYRKPCPVAFMFLPLSFVLLHFSSFLFLAKKSFTILIKQYLQMWIKCAYINEINL